MQFRKDKVMLVRSLTLHCSPVRTVSNSIKIPTRSFVGMTESSLFVFSELTVSCHPGLDPGSGSKNEQPGRVASERRTGLLGGDGGPLTDNVVFISDQRVLAFRRSAVLILAT
ncbi:hypothetical protein RJ60_13240 [Mesotoga sp. B105.6.4]|nr:hypothetical protein RJ60_13240 [Mesotoga sp. B105.6.4]